MIRQGINQRLTRDAEGSLAAVVTGPSGHGVPDDGFTACQTLRHHFSPYLTGIDVTAFALFFKSALPWIVSVQREPSGHNLKHPTKWCPPNNELRPKS